MALFETKKELLKQNVRLLRRKSKRLKLSPHGSKTEIIDRILAAYKNINNDNPPLSNHSNSLQIIQTAKDKKALLSARLNYKYKSNGPKKKCLVSYLRKSKSELLFYGYFRSLEKKKQIVIPRDVVTMFISFYYLSLPPYKLSRDNKFFVDIEHQILTTQHCNRSLHYTYLLFSAAWKGGKHELRVQCLKHNKRNIGIGMITSNNANDWNRNNLYSISRSWLFSRADSGLTYAFSADGASRPKICCYDFGSRRQCKNVNKDIYDGMIISIKVDLWERIVTFYFDDEKVGELCVGAGHYYPAISFECHRVEPFDVQYRLLLCD